jgi:2',3'-cyclic-nucleotide 2'-phosphodiesterase
VTDVGMTGSASGVMGFEPENFISGFKEGNPFAPPPAPAAGPVELGAVLLRIEGGKTREAERLR